MVVPPVDRTVRDRGEVNRHRRRAVAARQCYVRSSGLRPFADLQVATSTTTPDSSESGIASVSQRTGDRGSVAAVHHPTQAGYGGSPHDATTDVANRLRRRRRCCEGRLARWFGDGGHERSYGEMARSGLHTANAQNEEMPFPRAEPD